jgi:hypothetical protein
MPCIIVEAIVRLVKTREARRRGGGPPGTTEALPLCGAGDPRNFDLVAGATDAQNLQSLANGNRNRDQLGLARQ